MLLDKALKIHFCLGIPMSQTTDKIDALHAHIIASGLLDNDKLHAVLLNGLREFYPQLQLTIQVTSSSPNFSTESMPELSALTANSMVILLSFVSSFVSNLVGRWKVIL
jgi:hypothetical protein